MNTCKKTFRIGFIGFGTVAQAVWKNLEGGRLSARFGVDYELAKACVRDISKKRAVEIPAEKRQIFEETDYFIRRLELKPAIVICYDRQAFFGNDDKEFRLTFDGNIRSRRTELDLRKGDFGEPLSNQPFRVMEVKSAGAVPLWLVKILSANKIYTSGFSKYGNIYMNEIIDSRSEKLCFQA